MISRKNRAPSGKTSNRPTTSSLLTDRSFSQPNSSRQPNTSRLETLESSQNLLSPIKRPTSKMSQSGAWSLPSNSPFQRNNDNNTLSPSARSNAGAFSPSLNSDRSGHKSPHYSYGGRDFYLPEDRLNHNQSSKASLSSRNLLEDADTSLDDLTQLSTREILLRLRDKGNQAEKEKADLQALEESEYNDFSRPRPSTLYPHRTVFLDPTVNNISPSKSRTELLKKMRQFSTPHPSYDIDGDGDVSQEDYRLAKRFDFDGNGVIDPYERKIAKYVISDEFFKKHNEHMHVFGEEIAGCTHKENVVKLSRAPNFERTLTLLKGVEDSLRGRSSKEMVGCMESVHKEAVKQNFYTNKFDTTAFTNFEAVPVPLSDQGGKMDHNGSRLRLMESRKQAHKQECEVRMTAAQDKIPKNTTKIIKIPYD